MEKSKTEIVAPICPNCGASISSRAGKCEYCGSFVVIFGEEPPKQATAEILGVRPFDDELVYMELEAEKRFWLWCHFDCAAILTDQRLVFWDRGHVEYSFEISLDDLKNAKMTTKNLSDIIFTLAHGQTYELGLPTEEERKKLQKSIKRLID